MVKLEMQTQTQNKIKQTHAPSEKEGFLAEYEREALSVLEKVNCRDLIDDVKFVFKALRDAVKHAERKSKESIFLLLSIQSKINHLEEIVKERTRRETEEYIEYETEEYEDFMVAMKEALWETSEKVFEKLTANNK